jgi:hypothetical protein
MTTLPGVNCTGVKFYGFTGSTYDLSLWDPSGTQLATVTVGPLIADGPTIVTFGTEVALAAFANYYVSASDEAGTVIVGVLATAVNFPVTWGSTPGLFSSVWPLNPFVWCTCGNAMANGGNVWPNSNWVSGWCLVEPTLSMI